MKQMTQIFFAVIWNLTQWHWQNQVLLCWLFFFLKYTFANTLWSLCMLTLKEHFLIVQNVSSFLCWCSVGAQTPFVPFMLLWFSKRLFSAFFSLISLLSNILPQRDTALSDGCLFRVGTGNWVRHFEDNSAFVTENCLCDHNADIL